MIDLTFDLALKCPRCWREVLFCNFKQGMHGVADLGWYDKHGAAPTPGSGGGSMRPYLCPHCGGYMELHARHVVPTDPAFKKQTLEARARAH